MRDAVRLHWLMGVAMGLAAIGLVYSAAERDTRQAEASLRSARVAWLSPGVVLIADGALGFRAGLSVPDPDGHALQLRSP